VKSLFIFSATDIFDPVAITCFPLFCEGNRTIAQRLGEMLWKVSEAAGSETRVYEAYKRSNLGELSYKILT